MVDAGRRRVWWRRPSRADRAAVDDTLEAVGLGELASRSVTELSGGQAQRALLARALIQRPDVMIMDEPFAGLDLSTVDAVVALLARLVDDGTSVCCALHEPDIARYAPWDPDASGDVFEQLARVHPIVVGDDEQSLDREVPLAGFDAAKKPSIHAQCGGCGDLAFARAFA